MNESTSSPARAEERGPRLSAAVQDTGAEAPVQPFTRRIVISDDGIVVGRVEADAGTHLNVRVEEGDAPTGQLWIPKELVGHVDGERIYLTVVRADLHEAVLTLPPGQQREFKTLGLNVRIGRRRGLQGD